MRKVLITLSILASGCMSTPVQRAETLGEGDFAVGIEPGVSGFAGGGVGGFLPAFNLSGRYGVTDRFDLGARIGSSVYEVQAKIMLTDRDAATPISIAPATTFAAFGGGGAGAGFGMVKIPVLIGIPVGESQLVLGPMINNFIAFGSGEGTTAGGYALEVGTSVGFNGRVGPGLAIHPEFGMGYAVMGAASANGENASAGGGGIRWAFTLGIIVGNKLDK